MQIPEYSDYIQKCSSFSEIDYTSAALLFNTDLVDNTVSILNPANWFDLQYTY
jgi:hypothetical protein